LVVAEFLAQEGVLLDVRSPKEYDHGHIPGALSLPLFSDEERHEVGICYKQKGKKEAIELGVKLVGPKLGCLLQQAKALLVNSTCAKVYCWRGGMRSGFVSWFLNFAGYPTQVLPKGYKAWRHFAGELFQKNFQFSVIGGFTGSGKTKVLQTLKSVHQIIDLESLANHKGSAFGLNPQEYQPTQEQFENELAYSLHSLDFSRPIWVEDESRNIGSCQIPKTLFDMIKKAPLYFLEESEEVRLENILADYGTLPRDFLLTCAKKVERRLGSERCQEACKAIENNDLKAAAKILLGYYDATYSHCLENYVRSITKLSKESLLRRLLC